MYLCLSPCLWCTERRTRVFPIAPAAEGAPAVDVLRALSRCRLFYACMYTRVTMYVLHTHTLMQHPHPDAGLGEGT